MSVDYKYRLDVLYDDLGIGTDQPFYVDDDRTMPLMLKEYYDLSLDENTVFIADENGDLSYLAEGGIWVPLDFCFCRLLSLCDYTAELVPVCQHCLKKSDEELFHVFVDYDETTELWCRDCMDSCTWNCSECFDPFDSDLEHELNADYEYVCKKCHRRKKV